MFVEGCECSSLRGVTCPAHQRELWDELKSVQVPEDLDEHSLEADEHSSAGRTHRTGTWLWTASVTAALG